eukprot:TRINITY_DN81186_c0_g1_i1.p1 TRINITY_DN81186_c0_g1~~TRINITY_DN81186_c0_g1_i1.p1  ORF type:complete len:129 (+),score=7.76 TRINITY_DN81186_c0_g1_i1:29-388(+)
MDGLMNSIKHSIGSTYLQKLRVILPLMPCPSLLLKDKSSFFGPIICGLTKQVEEVCHIFLSLIYFLAGFWCLPLIFSKCYCYIGLSCLLRKFETTPCSLVFLSILLGGAIVLGVVVSHP